MWAGLAPSISASELAAVQIPAFISWVGEVAREAAGPTTEAWRLKSRRELVMVHLRYTKLNLANGKRITGMTALTCAAASCSGFEEASFSILRYMLEPTPLASYNSKKETGRRFSARRSSSISEEIVDPRTTASFASDANSK
jgi:hypothetical protein